MSNEDLECIYLAYLILKNPQFMKQRALERPSTKRAQRELARIINKHGKRKGWKHIKRAR